MLLPQDSEEADPLEKLSQTIENEPTELEDEDKNTGIGFVFDKPPEGGEPSILGSSEGTKPVAKPPIVNLDEPDTQFEDVANPFLNNSESPQSRFPPANSVKAKPFAFSVSKESLQSTTLGISKQPFKAPDFASQVKSTPTAGLFEPKKSAFSNQSTNLDAANVFAKPPNADGDLFGNKKSRKRKKKAVPFAITETGQNTDLGLKPKPKKRKKQKAKGGLFGNATAGQTNGGLFGNSSSNTNAGLFGAQQSNTNGGFKFGGTQPSADAVGLFGASQPKSSDAGGLFGASQSKSSDAGGLFGASQPNNTDSGGLFPASQTNSNDGLFGTKNKQSTEGDLFSSKQTTSDGGLFPTTQSSPEVFKFQPSSTSISASPSSFMQQAEQKKLAKDETDILMLESSSPKELSAEALLRIEMIVATARAANLTTKEEKAHLIDELRRELLMDFDDPGIP